MTRRRLHIAAFAAAIWSLPAGAQGYRVRLDASAQSVWFRGLAFDSVRASEVVASADGGLQTPDGHAVRCGSGEYCFFLKPGAVLRGVPASTTASASLWGFGIEGLSARATGRLIGDLGADDVWPATEPAFQLIEGYIEYQRRALMLRGGRQLVSSRLEAIGFDGGWIRARWDRASLEFTGYGGWGLGRAAVVPPTSPVLNPLDEFQPRKRQLVAGAEAALLSRVVDLRAEYRREIDPEDDYFVSERAALSFGVRAARLRFTGGMDYNIAEGHFGSADLNATYLRPRFSLTAGARRYRPYFSLWTLWGAFSPVPYNAVNLAAQLRPNSWLTLNARGESYQYEDAEVSVALVPDLRDSGWRSRLGATAVLNARWTLEGNYAVERGPGASSRSADAAVSYAPSEKFSIDVYGGSLARPLELRYYDAKSRWAGGRAQWQITGQRRLWGDASLVSDDRDRPDSGGWSLSQARFRAGISLTFGSGADRTPLPPARPLDR